MTELTLTSSFIWALVAKSTDRPLLNPKLHHTILEINVKFSWSFVIAVIADNLKFPDKIKDVTHDLLTHARLMKISGLTYFDVLNSNLKSLSQYNLWFISYESCGK